MGSGDQSQIIRIDGDYRFCNPSLMCPQHTDEGLAKKSYEDLVTSTLQEALATTRNWLRSLFKSRMLSRSSAAVHLTYAEEMAVSLPWSYKAAKGI